MIAKLKLHVFPLVQTQTKCQWGRLGDILGFTGNLVDNSGCPCLSVVKYLWQTPKRSLFADSGIHKSRLWDVIYSYHANAIPLEIQDFDWIFYWIELTQNNFELNIFLNWILTISFELEIELNHFWQFSFESKIELNHFQQFSFESKIELNHFRVKFNHWFFFINIY